MKPNNKTIRIGVVSDTHIPIAAPALPKALIDGLKGVDFIIHAGDLITLDVVRQLEKIAPVYAVSGNMDAYEAQNTLPKKKEVRIAGFKIGIIHGWGGSGDLLSRVRKEFKAVDVIIFGHSHKPFNQVVDGVLMFNPGSPTDKVCANTNTFGILTLNEEIKAEHIEV
ncbi:MAG: metallophosphoesterase family protein [Candidatus Omnitrophota bacterium]